MALRALYHKEYDADLVSRESGTVNKDESLTKQSFKDECDINVILNRFAITGQLPDNVRMPTFGDFTDVTDYQTAMNAAIAAQDSFMQMPANVRERFNNNPQQFVEFCSNDKNRDEAIKLGLVPEPPVKADPPKGASVASGPHST